MGNSEHYSWAATDRAQERSDEADEDFDKQLAAETVRQAAAIKTNCLTGHAQTLDSIAEGLAHSLGKTGITEHLVRCALSVGPLTAGQMLLAMINRAIDDEAELAALAEMERAEKPCGLNYSAMRDLDPHCVVPA